MGGAMPLVAGCGEMLLEKEMASRGGWQREEKAGGGMMLLTAGCGVMPLDGSGMVISVEKASSTSRGDRYVPQDGVVSGAATALSMSRGGRCVRQEGAVIDAAIALSTASGRG